MPFTKQTIRDTDLAGKHVLLRADYNVPQDDSGAITSDYRIQQSAPTIRHLLDQGVKHLTIMSHLGRPEPGKQNDSLSLRPVAAILADLLNEPVEFVSDCREKPSGQQRIALLENLRFCAEEEANDDTFAASLAQGNDLFVQDGFGVVHRAHASTDAITHHLPSVAGLLLEKEIRTITDALVEPERPFVAILGGAKVSDKIELIERFIDIADQIIIGGAMANTFLQQMGYAIGKSKVEPGQEAEIERIVAKAQTKIGSARALDDFLWLPKDKVVVGTELTTDTAAREVATRDVGSDEYILDVLLPPDLLQSISAAKTIIWNGPIGMTEFTHFAAGSRQLADTIASSGAVSIIGGGDTAGFIETIGKNDDFTHVSTGGGASLELMAGKKLPGAEALLDKP